MKCAEKESEGGRRLRTWAGPPIYTISARITVGIKISNTFCQMKENGEWIGRNGSLAPPRAQQGGMLRDVGRSAHIPKLL